MKFNPFLTTIIAVLAILALGCSEEMVVKEGDTVSVHYTGKLEDGTVFDSSEGGEPMKFEVGSEAIIPGFSLGVVGMKVGEQKTLTIPPEEAYGPRMDQLSAVVPKKNLPGDVDPEVGMTLQMTAPEGGQPMNVRITEVMEDSLRLDANHPLAGETLIFDIELIDIERP